MKIAILCMQKNEGDLLQNWIAYHESLFGSENIFIFDNGSDDISTIEVLRNASSRGVNVSFDYCLQKFFDRKGDVIAEKIIELDLLDIYDFYIPLDTDEFVAVQMPDGCFSCEISDIKEELSKWTGVNDTLIIDSQYFNSPISIDLFTKIHSTKKCFFSKGSCISLDVGYHHGISTGGGELKTKIVHFHFHNKPFELLQIHAKQKLYNRVDVNNKEALLEFNGNGLHLVKYLLISEFEFLSGLLKNHIFTISQVLSNKFAQLEKPWPFLKELSEANKKYRTFCSLPEKNIYSDLNLHRLSLGYIDQFIPEREYLLLNGWAIDGSGFPFNSFCIEIENTILHEVTDYQRIQRDDILNAYSGMCQNSKCGFLISVPKNLLSLNKINNLSIYGIQNCSLTKIKIAEGGYTIVN